MYRKAAGLLVLGSFVYMACFFCVKGVDAAQQCSEPVQRLKLELWEIEERAEEMEAGWAMKGEYSPDSGERGMGIVDVAVSGQRVVDFSVLEQTFRYDLSDEELEVLLRIVEAEAGNEDEEGKLLVANVVLNRVDSEQFPDSVTEVVFQKEQGVWQFSPVSNGSYYRVKISDETIHAVSRALTGENISQGALYFVARKYADSGKVKWFDDSLTYLFLHGGHEFFK